MPNGSRGQHHSAQLSDRMRKARRFVHTGSRRVLLVMTMMASAEMPPWQKELEGACGQIAYAYAKMLHARVLERSHHEHSIVVSPDSMPNEHLNFPAPFSPRYILLYRRKLDNLEIPSGSALLVGQSR